MIMRYLAGRSLLLSENVCFVARRLGDIGLDLRHGMQYGDMVSRDHVFHLRARWGCGVCECVSWLRFLLFCAYWGGKARSRYHFLWKCNAGYRVGILCRGLVGVWGVVWAVRVWIACGWIVCLDSVFG